MHTSLSSRYNGVFLHQIKKYVDVKIVFVFIIIFYEISKLMQTYFWCNFLIEFNSFQLTNANLMYNIVSSIQCSLW